MAKISIKIPTDLEKKFEELQNNSGEIIDKCVEAGAEVVEGYVRNNLRAVLSNDHKNGELINSLGITPVKVSREGVHNAKIGFAEPRKDQGGSHITRGGKKRTYYVRTNAMIANILEHGRSNQAARPFLAPAKRSAKQPTLEAMRKKFDEEVKK